MYDERCARYVERDEPAPTAEALMRSRYTAHALGRAGHLARTWAPETRPARIELDPQTRWRGLTVTRSTGGGLFDQTGSVSFAAQHETRGRRGEHSEHSLFRRHDGHWVYVSAYDGPDETLSHTGLSGS